MYFIIIRCSFLWCVTASRLHFVDRSQLTTSPWLTDCARNLGAYYNASMNMSTHAAIQCCSCLRRSTRMLLSLDKVKTLRCPDRSARTLLSSWKVKMASWCVATLPLLNTLVASSSFSFYQLRRICTIWKLIPTSAANNFVVSSVNPLDARSQSTDFAQTSLRCQESVDRLHGISTPMPGVCWPTARYMNATGR